MNPIVLLALSLRVPDMEGIINDDELRGAVTAARAKQKAQALEEAALTIMELQTEVANHKNSSLLAIRQVRKAAERQVRSHKEAMDARALALAYGLETKNFIPLMLLRGRLSKHILRLDLSEEDCKALSTIPKDWQPQAK
jgi:hypothetical protein